MDLDIRKAVINNLNNASHDDIETTIKNALELSEEKTLPGLGVLFEILWKNSDMNLFEMLSDHNVVYWHDEKPEDMTVMETRTAATRAEVYISSVNGISEAGEIVNIDNTGNRVAAISYGPSKIYLVIGTNKIASDLERAIYRARNIASPLNAKRLNRKTPCAVKGDKCYDCNSPERICRNLSILWSKPTGADYEVILIKEELGF